MQDIVLIPTWEYGEKLKVASNLFSNVQCIGMAIMI